jgi:hypothetical protein
MRRGPLLIAIALTSAPAFGCGYCIEDKVAAAYDHALVAQTVARGHDVAFIGFESRAPSGKDKANSIRHAIEGIAGVDRGGVRVAAESGSISVAFDPRRLPPGKLIAALDRELAPLGVETTLLRFGDPGSAPGKIAVAPALRRRAE